MKATEKENKAEKKGLRNVSWMELNFKLGFPGKMSLKW